MKKVIGLLKLLLCYNALHAQIDTLKLYFPHDVYKLDTRLQRSLDSMLYADAINNRQNLLIVGYTDHLGTDAHNERLSNNRAKEIQNYLVQMRIPAANIKLCIGKGELQTNNTSNTGIPPNRRVDIVTSILGKATVKNIPQAKPAAPKQVIPNIEKVAVGQTLRLQNIYFELGRHVVTHASIPALQALYETMVAMPQLKIQIEGHICCLRFGVDALDEDTREISLSANRAKFIYNYLLERGIDKERISYKGFGKSRPLVWPEKTIEDEEKNRRVEIRVLSK
jgi:outer membrane protein OmpA-like peptidoglycan-associated protein